VDQLRQEEGGVGRAEDDERFHYPHLVAGRLPVAI
jgi:hypothetical protein